MQESVRLALAELSAATQREYLNERADREAAERYYADVDPGGGDAFVPALSALLERSHRPQPEYRPALELYPWVDLQPNGQLRSVYTEEEYDARELIEEAAEVEARRVELRAERRAAGLVAAVPLEAEVEAANPYNCEHTVPQAWFAHDEPMRGDLHHLFTCEQKCNNFRGSAPFADYPEHPERVLRERCGNAEAAGFEPWAGKGLVARATLYFLIRYPSVLAASLDSQRVYTGEGLTMLLDWHEAEPVTDYERHRNAAIFERQGNRNPLIDHPEWARQFALT